MAKHFYTARARAVRVTILRTEGRLTYWHDEEYNVDLFGNDTRLGEYLASKERDEQIKTFLANGGTIKNVELDVAGGLKRSKYVPRKGPTGKRAMEPIKTGDAKFDMYLNALPPQVRVLVVPLGLDPRALYKEYRAIKKQGMIDKYDTPENRALATEKVCNEVAPTLAIKDKTK